MAKSATATAPIASEPSANGTHLAAGAFRMPAVWEWHALDQADEPPAYPGWEVHVRANYAQAEWEGLFGRRGDVARVAQTLIDAVRVVTPDRVYDYWPNAAGEPFPSPTTAEFWEGAQSIPTHLATRALRAVRQAGVTIPKASWTPTTAAG